jgi:cytoskeletal protein RodZ
MRKFLVIAVLVALTWLFVAQKRSQPQKPATTTKSVAQVSGSPAPRPASEHNWMKRSLDRTNEVTRQVAQQRKADGSR